MEQSFDRKNGFYEQDNSNYKSINIFLGLKKL
jgi:hypothetical protein